MKNYFKNDYGNGASDSSLFYKKKYDEADGIFEKRFEGSKNAPKTKNLENLISLVDRQIHEDNETDPKLISLVLGNAYLRLAQCQSEIFEKSKGYYAQALEYLERHIDFTDIDETDLLIMLNKGKYFRNTAEVGRKSDYERAFSIFQDVVHSVQNIEISHEKKFHLLLDAKINMGRVKRYSYEFKYAQKIFLSLICSLEKYMDDSIKRELHDVAELDGMLKSMELDSDIEQYDQLVKKDDVLEYSLEYVLQSLIHIGIIYRKDKKYEKAVEIFELIKRIDRNSLDGNIDAKNNLGVCYRKLGEKKEQEKQEGKDYYIKAKKISQELADKGNKFAAINLYKCRLNGTGTECKKLIKELEEKDGLDNSMHLRFILGRAYAKTGDHDKAISYFEDIYKEKSHIARGSLGFKVYYNLAQSKIRINEFYQARGILSEIRDLLKKNHNHTDILTEIDYGWCLMKEGRYNKALEIYKDSLNLGKKEGDKKQLAKINNNIADCYIHLEKYREAQQYVNEVLNMEKDNKWALYLKGIISLNIGCKNEGGDYTDSYSLFDSLMEGKFVGEGLNSAWLASAVLLYNQNKDENLADNIIKKINYSLGPINMKSFIFLSDFIIKKLGENKGRDYDTLYRDFCNIKLIDRGENQAFQHLMNSVEFHYFKPEDRAFILANIVLIYKSVLRIKDSCLVTYDEKGEVKLPCHYTKLNTLDNLLIRRADEKPRLRLWNTAYMNDAYEGKVFDKLLGESLAGSPMIEKYIGSSTVSNAYIDSNVYITSFSTAENSFQMWSIYGENEKGVAIKFEGDFFDIKDNCRDEILDNGGSDGYALYRVQYLDISNEEWMKSRPDLNQDLDRIRKHLGLIEERLSRSDMEKDSSEYRLFKNAETEVRAFIVDRLNEVRFLFKTKSYEYENELRLIRYSHQPNVDYTNFSPPRLYINVEKDIDDLDITIGSKLEDQKIKDLFVWLKNTKKAKNIRLSDLNGKD